MKFWTYIPKLHGRLGLVNYLLYAIIINQCPQTRHEQELPDNQMRNLLR